MPPSSGREPLPCARTAGLSGASLLCFPAPAVGNVASDLTECMFHLTAPGFPAPVKRSSLSPRCLVFLAAASHTFLVHISRGGREGLGSIFSRNRGRWHQCHSFNCLLPGKETAPLAARLCSWVCRGPPGQAGASASPAAPRCLRRGSPVPGYFRYQAFHADWKFFQFPKQPPNQAPERRTPGSVCVALSCPLRPTALLPQAPWLKRAKEPRFARFSFSRRPGHMPPNSAACSLRSLGIAGHSRQERKASLILLFSPYIPSRHGPLSPPLSSAHVAPNDRGREGENPSGPNFKCGGSGVSSVWGQLVLGLSKSFP